MLSAITVGSHGIKYCLEARCVQVDTVAVAVFIAKLAVFIHEGVVGIQVADAGLLRHGQDPLIRHVDAGVVDALRRVVVDDGIDGLKDEIKALPAFTTK